MIIYIRSFKSFSLWVGIRAISAIIYTNSCRSSNNQIVYVIKLYLLLLVKMLFFFAMNQMVIRENKLWNQNMKKNSNLYKSYKLINQKSF